MKLLYRVVQPQAVWGFIAESDGGDVYVTKTAPIGKRYRGVDLQDVLWSLTRHHKAKVEPVESEWA